MIEPVAPVPLISVGAEMATGLTATGVLTVCTELVKLNEPLAYFPVSAPLRVTVRVKVLLSPAFTTSGDSDAVMSSPATSSDTS